MPKQHARILPDTNVFINMLRGSRPHIDAFIGFKSSGSVMLLAPIVVAEIYSGAFEREFSTIEGLFALCEPLAMDISAARLAGRLAMRYRKSHAAITLDDYLIAALAMTAGSALWTENLKHFPMSGLTLV